MPDRPVSLGADGSAALHTGRFYLRVLLSSSMASRATRRPPTRCRRARLRPRPRPGCVVSPTGPSCVRRAGRSSIRRCSTRTSSSCARRGRFAEELHCAARRGRRGGARMTVAVCTARPRSPSTSPEEKKKGAGIRSSRSGSFSPRVHHLLQAELVAGHEEAKEETKRLHMSRSARRASCGSGGSTSSRRTAIAGAMPRRVAKPSRGAEVSRSLARAVAPGGCTLG